MSLNAHISLAEARHMATPNFMESRGCSAPMGLGQGTGHSHRPGDCADTWDVRHPAGRRQAGQTRRQTATTLGVEVTTKAMGQWRPPRRKMQSISKFTLQGAGT